MQRNETKYYNSTGLLSLVVAVVVVVVGGGCYRWWLLQLAAVVGGGTPSRQQAVPRAHAGSVRARGGSAAQSPTFHHYRYQQANEVQASRAQRGRDRGRSEQEPDRRSRLAFTFEPLLLFLAENGNPAHPFHPQTPHCLSFLLLYFEVALYRGEHNFVIISLSYLTREREIK